MANHREEMQDSNPFAPEVRKPGGSEKPVVGQSKPYNHTNAHGKNEKRTDPDSPTAGNAAASQPRHGYGWPNLRSPSKKT